jgi:uncharacterized protein (TIGR02453 family)
MNYKLQPATIQFLADLDANNHKAWFDEHRKAYEAAKKDFEGFVSELMVALRPVMPELEGQLAKDNVFRIFRDVRFGKDKTPYKNNFGAGLSRNGKKDTSGGYYLHIQPGGHSFLAGGMWQPEPDVLKKIRQELDYNYASFLEIINKPEFKKLFPAIEGESLSRPPKGYEADHPAIEHLKLKSFTTSTMLPDELLTSDQLIDKIVEASKVMKPFLDFLNEGLD